MCKKNKVFRREQRPLPFWFTLCTAVLSLFVLAFLLLSLIITSHYERQRLDQVRELLAMQSVQVCNRYLESLKELDYQAERLRTMADKAIREKQVLGRSLLSQVERVNFALFAYYLKEEAGSACSLTYHLPNPAEHESVDFPAWESYRYLNSEGFDCYAFIERTSGAGRQLTAAQLIYLEGDPFFFLCHKNLGFLETELYLLKGSIILYALPFFLLVAFLVYGASRYFTRDIVQLSKKAEAFEAGRISKRLILNGSREMRRLGQAFQFMEEKIASQITELLEKNERQERFLLALNHEYKTPLTAMLLHVKILSFPGLSEERRGESLYWLQDSLQGLEDLRQKTMEIFFQEGSIKKEKLNFYRFLQDFVEKLPAYYPKSNCSFVLDADELLFSSADKEEFLLEADPLLLHQLLLNLVDNAVEASRKVLTESNQESGQSRDCEGLIVTIKATRSMLAVIDHGPGLSESDYKHVTEAFYRVEATQGEGTSHYGLGLFLVRQIVQWHDWQLFFKPTPGGGLTVVLHF